MDLKNTHIPVMNVSDEDIVEAFRVSCRLMKADKIGNYGKWERNSAISFDNKVEGVLGEIAIKNFLLRNGIYASRSEYIGPGEYGNRDFEAFVRLMGINRRSVLEIKTSYLPDRDTSLFDFLRNEDIKIYAYSDDPVNDRYLHCKDIFIQLVVNTHIGVKNKFLYSVIGIDSDLESDVEKRKTYIEFCKRVYKNNMYFVGWTTSEHEIETLNKYPKQDRQWAFSHASSSTAYWKSKFTDAYAPCDLVPMLKGE